MGHDLGEELGTHTSREVRRLAIHLQTLEDLEAGAQVPGEDLQPPGGLLFHGGDLVCLVRADRGEGILVGDGRRQTGEE